MPNQNIGIEERIAKEAAGMAHDFARKIAGVQGPGPGARLVTGREEIDLWDEKSADPMALFLKYRGEGLTVAQAKTKATIDSYPNRAVMMLSAGTDEEEQRRYARRLNNAAMKPAEGVIDVSRSEY